MVNNSVYKIPFEVRLFLIEEKVLDGFGYKYDYSSRRSGILFVHLMET